MALHETKYKRHQVPPDEYMHCYLSSLGYTLKSNYEITKISQS